MIPRHLNFVIDWFSFFSNLYDQKTIFQLQINAFIHANIIKDEISLTIDIVVTPRINLKKYKFHIFLTSIFSFSWVCTQIHRKPKRCAWYRRIFFVFCVFEYKLRKNWKLKKTSFPLKNVNLDVPINFEKKMSQCKMKKYLEFFFP